MKERWVTGKGEVRMSQIDVARTKRMKLKGMIRRLKKLSTKRRRCVFTCRVYCRGLQTFEYGNRWYWKDACIARWTGRQSVGRTVLCGRLFVQWMECVGGVWRLHYYTDNHLQPYCSSIFIIVTWYSVAQTAPIGCLIAFNPRHKRLAVSFMFWLSSVIYRLSIERVNIWIHYRLSS